MLKSLETADRDPELAPLLEVIHRHFMQDRHGTEGFCADPRQRILADRLEKDEGLARMSDDICCFDADARQAEGCSATTVVERVFADMNTRVARVHKKEAETILIIG